jgi:hypothetical protein
VPAFPLFLPPILPRTLRPRLHRAGASLKLGRFRVASTVMAPLSPPRRRQPTLYGQLMKKIYAFFCLLLTAASGSLAQSWVRQHPNPQTAPSLPASSSPTRNTGGAMSGISGMEKTTDGGQSWQPSVPAGRGQVPNHAFHQPFRGLDCRLAQQPGNCVPTTDGGQSWQTQFHDLDPPGVSPRTGPIAAKCSSWIIHGLGFRQQSARCTVPPTAAPPGGGWQA